VSGVIRVGVAILATIALLVASAAGQEQIMPNGIFAAEHYTLLTAEVTADVCDPGPPPHAAQLLVSFDEGRTWDKRGPQLDGSEFEWVFEAPQGVWIAGEYVVEGPNSEAFVLVPSGTSIPQWRKHVIYDQAEDLLAIAFDGPRLVAWLRHLELGDDDWQGPIYRHVSADGGRRWQAPRRVAALPDTSALLAFAPIEREHKGWRLVELADGAVTVQHQRDGVAPWETVSTFPQVPCATAARD
jgi:hypothetical protein